MDLEKEKQIRKAWLKEKRIHIILITLAVIALFILSHLLHQIFLVVSGAFLGFGALFYYHNQLAARIEAEYPEEAEPPADPEAK